MIVARVLPNVTGLDKHFDYLVPERLAPLVTIGTIVRVPLHGRRVGGWVTALGEPHVDRDTLKEITGVTGAGPSAELIALAEWAGVRWAARRRHFLVAASPERAVRQLPGAQRTGRIVEPRSGATTSILTSGGGVLRLPPTADPLPSVYSAAALGPTLVVVPALEQVRVMGARLRRAGFSVADRARRVGVGRRWCRHRDRHADRRVGSVSGHRRGGRDRRARRGVAEREQPDLARP